MSPYTLLAFVVVGLALGPALVTAQASRSSYGESCNATNRCSKRDWLRCNNGVCDCIKSDIMIFEKASDFDTLPSLAQGGTPSMATSGAGRCSIKVGERCRFNLGSDESGTAVLDVFPCSKNSICDSEGFCACQEGYYENWNGTCAKFQEHMQPCNAELKCKSEFRCYDNLCRCESNSLVYSDKVNKCVALAGIACHESGCIKNASCTGNATCTCDIGFYQNEQNGCSPQLDYGVNCSSDEQCGHDKISKFKLLCDQGKCGCDSSISHFSTVRKHHHNYYYNSFQGFEGPEFSLCAPKPGNECTDYLCAVNSYCTDEGNDGICICDEGSSVSRLTGLCALSYDSDCTSTGVSCADDLVCMTPGRCSCRNARQQYDSTKKRCISQVNGPCTEDADCISNAHCASTSSVNNGRCQCNEGFILDGNKGCVASINTKCAYGNGECDSAAGLICIEGRCSCQDGFVYSDQLQKCVGSVGSPCRITDKEGTACVSGATCKSSRNFPVYGRSDIEAFCTCDKGFVEAADYTCVLPEPMTTEASLGITKTEEVQEKLDHAPKLTTQRVPTATREYKFGQFSFGDYNYSE